MKTKPSSKRASSLVLVMIISAVLCTALAGLASYVSLTSKIERASESRLRAAYAAEYALEKNFGQLSDWLTTNRPAIATMSNATTLANLSTAPTSVFSSSNGYTFEANIIVPVENGLAVANHGATSQATNTYRYLISSKVSHVGRAGASAVQVHLQQEIAYKLTPIFQYAIFYNNDMELFPGAAFVVGGRVHSNGKFYNGSNASLTFNDYVSTVNGTLNAPHPLDPRGNSHANNVYYNVGNLITTSEEPPAMTVNTSDSNSNNDGARELIEIPASGFADVNQNERMFNGAGLKVLVNSSGSDVTAPNGTNIPAGTRALLTLDGTRIPDTDPLYTAITSSAAFSSSTLRDYRESTTSNVITTDIDVSVLRTKVSSGEIPTTIPNQTAWDSTTSVPASLRGQPIPSNLRGKTLWNGQLYVADVTYAAGRRVGVRLKNGESLPNGGLTLTTENPAYIVGNYNTGGNPAVNTTGSALTAANYVAGYYQPAAVLADAVTILSSNWNTTQLQPLNSRVPTNTTINTAIIAGNVPTSAAAYSGGVENFLRLLESWSGVRLTYYGSLVNLFPSAQATSNWVTTGTYYNAPARNWYFDTNFYDPSKLPKGTPLTRSIKRGQWMQL